MLEIFEKGGPIMWPLLLTSLIALTVVIERIIFIVRERSRRDPEAVQAILSNIERADIQAAIKRGRQSGDFVARTLVYALDHREQSFSNALLRAAGQELKRFNRGISWLDTIITLAPLLGLLGTVTGMIHTFGFVGGAGPEASAAITGGIAKAMITTAFGLGIAIVVLIPFNYLNSFLEQTRHEIEDAASHMELLLIKTNNTNNAFRRTDS